MNRNVDHSCKRRKLNSEHIDKQHIKRCKIEANIYDDNNVKKSNYNIRNNITTDSSLNDNNYYMKLSQSNPPPLELPIDESTTSSSELSFRSSS